jgi:hypothetical protein
MEESVPYGLLQLQESFKDDMEYKASNCLSYSRIKDVYDNPEVLIQEQKHEEKEYFNFGSVVDIMLTEPESVDSKILVNDLKPSEQFLKISTYILDNGLGADLNNLTNDQIEDIYNITGSSVNWKVDTKKQKLLAECSEYIKIFEDNRDKLIISSSMYTEAYNIAEVLRNHPWSKHLFISKDEQKQNNVEIIYQFKIKFDLEGMNFKSKIDIIYIDHNNKIISPWDIKTGSDYPRNFVKTALYKYKYGYQGVIYKEGLTKIIDKLPSFDFYTVDLFRFLYISRLVPKYPIIAKMSETCHREFHEWGIQDGYWDIPALLDVLEAAEIYLRQFDLGETNIAPLDLQKCNGEIMVHATITKNKSLVY